MKILIADDHGIVRCGLKVLIAKEPDMEVVGEAEDGDSVLKLAKELSPDVIIMDIAMPGMNGIEATRQILKENPAIRIIALSMYSEKYFVTEMLKAGASGYVLKSYLFDEISKALHAAVEGKHYLSPRITDVLVDEYVHHGAGAGKSAADTLTDREREVLQLIAQGKSTKEIALYLKISPKTADSNRRQIMNKLGVFTIAELTKYAIREGLTSINK
jgi:DNA-binding NarL/FixJ family response regulator